MKITLKATPEEIAEVETKKAIKIYWSEILEGQYVNPTLSEWQELIENHYIQITDNEKYWSGTAETRVYEFVKNIAQLCRASMTTKLKKISEQLSNLKKEFAE